MTTETTNTEYASKGVAGTGLGLGIAGTALALLNGGGLLLSNGGIGTGRNQPAYVSKDEYAAGQQIAAKDAEIALLKADQTTNTKIIETYKEIMSKVNALEDKLDSDNEKILTRTDGQFVAMNDKVDENRDRSDSNLAAAVDRLNGKIDFNKSFQDGVNAQQLAYNGTNGATIACMQNQIAQLQGMTKLVIPNSSVMPGWGGVTIYPTPLSST